MELLKVCLLVNSINKQREEMYTVVKKNGISHPKVIKISQELDVEINKVQNLLIQYN